MLIKFYYSSILFLLRILAPAIPNNDTIAAISGTPACKSSPVFTLLLVLFPVETAGLDVSSPGVVGVTGLSVKSLALAFEANSFTVAVNSSCKLVNSVLVIVASFKLPFKVFTTLAYASTISLEYSPFLLPTTALAIWSWAAVNWFSNAVNSLQDVEDEINSYYEDYNFNYNTNTDSLYNYDYDYDF